MYCNIITDYNRYQVPAGGDIEGDFPRLWQHYIASCHHHCRASLMSAVALITAAWKSLPWTQHLSPSCKHARYTARVLRELRQCCWTVTNFNCD